MSNKMVSIISPCYNGEKFVSRFIESVIAQDYRPIELIIINDGSTDHTASVLSSFVPQCEQNGIRFSIFSQANKGQAAAINVGLKNYTGEYLMWFDSDDILLPQNVSKKVDFLENNPRYGFVLGEGAVVSEDKPEDYLRIIRRVRPEGSDPLFEDLIYERNVVFCPGVIMAKRDAVDSAIPLGEIYESREGQNWQLMLPLAYNYECGYIEETVFLCVEHPDSHSRQKRTFQQHVERQYKFEELLVETIHRIQQMPEEEKSEWEKKIRIKHSTNILRMALEKRDNKLYRKMKKRIQSFGGKVDGKDTLLGYPLNKKLIKIYSAMSPKMKTAVKKLFIRK